MPPSTTSLCRCDAKNLHQHLHQRGRRLDRDGAANDRSNRNGESAQPDPASNPGYDPVTETVICNRLGAKHRFQQAIFDI
jgi:hypothetical protein